MELTTMALVLREVDYKDSDKILTVLTPHQGKLTLWAPKVRTKRDATAACCQVLVWGEFTLSRRGERYRVTEANAHRHFRRVVGDLDKLALASYFAQVTETLAEEGQVEPELLSLTLNCLHILDQKELPLTQVKSIFEWRSMAIFGLLPQVEGCVVCGEVGEEMCFSPQGGGICCTKCQPHLGVGEGVPLTPAALQALRHILWGDPKRMAAFTLDTPSLKLLATASERYLLTCLERGFHTLDFYKSITTET